MSQNNRRGQRGAAREKHICSEIHEHGQVPEWAVSVMHEISLVSAPKSSLTAEQCRQLWDNSSCAEPGCPMCPATRALALLSALPAQCNWEIPFYRKSTRLVLYEKSISSSEKCSLLNPLKCPKGTGKALSDTLLNTHTGRGAIFLYKKVNTWSQSC